MSVCVKLLPSFKQLQSVAYRGVNSCVRRNSGEARVVSAAGAFFCRGLGASFNDGFNI